MGLGDMLGDVKDGINSAADTVGNAVDGVKEAAGEAVDYATDKTADTLDFVGADGAAKAVRSAGDDVADALGAQVDERQLGESDDPKELIHGDVAKINESAAHLKDFYTAFERVGQGIRKLDAGSWKGKAADSFHEKFDVHPKQWMRTADACEAAWKALDSYAETVSWAQKKGQSAIDAWQAAENKTRKAQDAYRHQLDTYLAKADAYNAARDEGSDPGPKPDEPGEFHDPGDQGREAAQDILKNARSQRNEAAEKAQHALKGALEHAPQAPKFTTEAAFDTADGIAAGGMNLMHVVGGAGKAVVETVNLARTLNPAEPYNLAHPQMYLANVAKTGLGLASAAAHPGRLAKGMLGDGWGSDPFDAGGAFLANLVGGKGAGAIGKGVVKAGAKDAAKGAAREAVKDGGKRTVRDRLREIRCKTVGGDPIDMATGRMILPQTDVTLPASLPLAFTRTFESSYRTGHWFGPTWMSTVDQRLEIDAEGVILIGEEGNFLLYPHPAVGVPTLPAEGDGHPLERTPDGDYLLTDPVTGTRRYFTTCTEDLAVLDEISDHRGNHHTFDYTEDGTPTAITHSAGYRLLLTTEEGRITALHLAGAAPDGSDQLLVTYGYDEQGNLTRITNSSGLPLRFTYDDAGRITSWTDTNNSSYTYAYDDQDRCTSQGGIEGHLRAHFTWGNPDPVTGLRTNLHHNSLGQVTTYQVNEHHQIVASTDATGATTHIVRDAMHRILSITDPLGRATYLAYDHHGRPTTVTLPDGSASTTAYTLNGNPASLTGPDGTTWTHTYDVHGNRTSTTDPTGAITAYTHDHRGHIASITDALGNTTRLYCNEAGLPLTVTDPLGATTRYRLDAFGRTTSVTDPLGEVTHYVWSVEGRLTARIDPTGATEEWTYDGEGNRLTHTDAMGQTTRYDYGHFDLLTARTDTDGVRYRFTHDTELRLTQVTNPQGLTWNYTYDPAGRLTCESDFDGRTLGYTHDPAGQLTTRTNTLGEVTTYTRDTLGRITHKDAACLVTTYVHDADSNLQQAANSDATVTYTRDALGRVTAETVNGHTMTFTYDALGRRTSRTTPTGHTTTYAYDAAGNRTTLNTGRHTLTFDHDATGQEVARTIGDHLALTHTWDPSGRLTSQSLTTAATGTLQSPTAAARAQNPAVAEAQRVLHRGYTYRPDGNLTAIDDSHTGRRTFDLDPAGRVTAVHATDWAETYAYDEAGNQTHATWPDHHPNPSARGDRTYTGTRITKAGAIRYEHDSLGQVTLRQKTRLSRKPDTWHYTWNAEGRLTSVVTPDGATWRYLYDPFGRRIAKQRLAEDTSVVEQIDFVWDGPTLAEQTSHTSRTAPSITLTWEYEGTTPLCQTERKTSSQFLTRTPQQVIDQRFFAMVTDLVGTPVEMVSEDGDVAWSRIATLWGSTTWPTSAKAYTPLRFPGQYFDPEIGIHYNYFRYYDPEAARYLTPDPLGLEPADNPTAYIANPNSWMDPNGLAGCKPSLASRLKSFFGKPDSTEVTPTPPKAPRMVGPASPSPGSVADLHGPYHRLFSEKTQSPAVTQQVLESGELWGRESRWGGDPMVQAHRGHIPSNAAPGSFEFYTSVEPKPIKNTPPGYVAWELGQQSGVGSVIHNGEEFARIPVFVTEVR
ncbi:putative T7SS-secreted protein [Streptomyces decoyicus]|uniref:putative T7SS-secreted protein n=1 Tax=Streptomyces decoyicus TaxID=249567 RepID=UPI003862F527